jgi:uncharacterized protein YeaO (DUF488 family)
MPILVKRAYDKPSKDDGVRALVERTWPRGLGKVSARLDIWLPALGPSADLSEVLQSNHSRATNILKRYFAELNTPEAMDALQKLHTFASSICLKAERSRQRAAVRVGLPRAQDKSALSGNLIDPSQRKSAGSSE